MSTVARLLAPIALAAALAMPAQAQNRIKVGVLTDLSGAYADLSGTGSVVAARMAAEDFAAANPGFTVEVVSGDHLNKSDVAATLARRWIDQDGVDVIADVPNSAAALAVSEVSREKKRVLLDSGAGTADLTGARCAPYTVHWTYDTWALAHGTAQAMVQQGGTSWFFITADYAFGHAMARDAGSVVRQAGGTVVGEATYPFPSSDFSSTLLQAKSSGAKVIGLANGGTDLINAIKLAAARAEGRVGGRRKKLDAAKRREIAESVISGRKTGAEMARLCNVSSPTVSRIIATHRTSLA